MSIIFYKLNGFNDPTLKHVFIASLPKELQPELQRQININQLNIADMSLRKIYQLAINCLERLCELKEFFKDLMQNKPYLKIKCKFEKDCDCLPKKRSHFRKTGHKSKLRCVFISNCKVLLIP